MAKVRCEHHNVFFHDTQLQKFFCGISFLLQGKVEISNVDFSKLSEIISPSVIWRLTHSRTFSDSHTLLCQHILEKFSVSNLKLVILEHFLSHHFLHARSFIGFGNDQHRNPNINTQRCDHLEVGD